MYKHDDQPKRPWYKDLGYIIGVVSAYCLVLCTVASILGITLKFLIWLVMSLFF